MSGTAAPVLRRGRPWRRLGAATCVAWPSPEFGVNASWARSASKRNRARGPSPRRTPPSRSAFAYTQSRATPSCSASSCASTKPTFAGADDSTSARRSATASISSISNTRRRPRRVASNTISRAIRGARRDEADLGRSVRITGSGDQVPGQGLNGPLTPVRDVRVCVHTLRNRAPRKDGRGGAATPMTGRER